MWGVSGLAAPNPGSDAQKTGAEQKNRRRKKDLGDACFPINHLFYTNTVG